jgi:hypothetical protein
MLFRILTGATVALISVLPATASAVGLEVTTRLGYGSAGSESPVFYEPHGIALADPGPIFSQKATPYGGGLIFQGGLGLRTGKYVSVGLSAGIRNASAESPSPEITDLKRSAWNAGPYVRVYIPMVPIVDPYIGLGVEYVSDRQQYLAPFRQPNGSAFPGVTHTLEYHGIGVPITLGVDYTIAKMFSVGPSFQYALVFPAGGCAKYNAQNLASVSDCAADNQRFTAVKGMGVWSIGLSLRLTVPPM